MTAPHPRRRIFRYSLRTLFVVVTVFCVWLGVIAKQAREQRLAVEAIEAMGGAVWFEHKWTKSDPPGPEWLRQLIGDEYFFSVQLVSADGPKINDVSLAVIKRLSDVEILSLRGARITDAGLVHLKGLTNLKGVVLGSTRITDAGLVHLKSLTNLQHLDLNGTQVTDAGLVHLRGLANLQQLILNRTRVTKGGMKKLQQALPNCDIIH